MENTNLLTYDFIGIGGYHLNLLQLIMAVAIFLVARVSIALFSRFVLRRMLADGTNPGRYYAIKQLFKYVAYTFTVLIIFQTLGINLSVIWAGAAALMVGIGLGLQQTFTDLISGIILLIEGAVSIGDIVVVDGIVGKVSNIGLRTSSVVTRDDDVIIVPNSKFVGEKVSNWSHNQVPMRFQLGIGIGYNADVDVATKLLMQAAKEHDGVLPSPAAWVQFTDFADSSLALQLHFYSKDLMGIECVKSELRFAVNRLFRSEDVEIPFPQRDLWIRNPEALRSPVNGKHHKAVVSH